MMQAEGFTDLAAKIRARHRSAARRRSRWRASLGRFSRTRRTNLRPAQTQRPGLHRLFLRHRRPPQRLRPNPRKLSRTMRRANLALSFLARRALPQHPSHESRDRFHGWLHRAVHLRRHSRASAHPAPRIHPRSLHQIQNHLHGASAHDPEKSGTRPAPKIRGSAADQTQNPERSDCHKSRPHAPPPPPENQPRAATASSPSVRRRTARPLRRRRLHRTRNAAVFLRSGNSGGQWLRLHRSRHRNHG